MREHAKLKEAAKKVEGGGGKNKRYLNKDEITK